MTKKIEDGGYAFPWQVSIPAGSFNAIRNRTVPKGEIDNEIFPGMSLRDWFAGQAIPAIIERCGADHRQSHEHITDYFARKAYEVADAMISARKAGEA